MPNSRRLGRRGKGFVLLCALNWMSVRDRQDTNRKYRKLGDATLLSPTGINASTFAASSIACMLLLKKTSGASSCQLIPCTRMHVLLRFIDTTCTLSPSEPESRILDSYNASSILSSWCPWILVFSVSFRKQCISGATGTVQRQTARSFAARRTTPRIQKVHLR